MTIPFYSVIEGFRIRNGKKYGDVVSLASRIKTMGSINPIGLSRRKPNNPDEEKRVDAEGFVYELIHGGRRYKAMQQLKITELHYGSMLNPEKLGFLWAEQVPEHTLREAEIDENLHRLDLDWVDLVLGISDIHTAKKKANLKWTQSQTAKLLPKTWGKTAISNFLIIAELLRKGDKEILACENMAEALKVRLKRNEDIVLAELQRRILPKAVKGATSTASFLDNLNINTVPEAKRTASPRLPDMLPGDKKANSTPQPQAVHSSAEEKTPSSPLVIPLSKMFTLGDFRTILPQLPDSCINHVVTDIPYGIDMSNLDLEGLESVVEEHDVQQNVDQMPEFLRQAFRITKSGGFCVFFYDLDHHEKLLQWSRDIGWRPQPWPFIACKTSACRNQAAQKNFTKNYEVAMILRRDETSALREPVPTSWKPYDFRVERKMYSNPFAKPFELWRDIYKAIAYTGQTVIDPFCGEMSACKAAINCGLVPFGVEISEKHYNRGLLLVQGEYNKLHRNNVVFE